MNSYPLISSHGQQNGGQFGQFNRNNFHQPQQQQFNHNFQHRFNFQGRNFPHSRQFPETSQYQPQHSFYYYKPGVSSFQPSPNQPGYYTPPSFSSISSCPQVAIFNETVDKIFGKLDLTSLSDTDGIEIEIEFNYPVLTFLVSINLLYKIGNCTRRVG